MSVDSATAIREGMQLARWDVTDLWVASVGIGGTFAQIDVEHIADGSRAASEVEHDILAATLNDHFTGRGSDHPVRYWRELAALGDG